MNKKIIIALVALGGTLTIAALCLMMPLQQSVAQQTAHVIHALVLPPGATSATDTVKILPNGTAVVIVPTHANYTKTLAANQTFTIAPQESVTGGFALPPNISNVYFSGSVQVVGGDAQIRVQLYDTTNCRAATVTATELAQCGQKYIDKQIDGSLGLVHLTAGRNYITIFTNDAGSEVKHVTHSALLTYTIIVNGTK